MSICTDSFLVPAHAMAQPYGFPEYEFVTVPHPIASLDSEQIQARARDVLPEVLRILIETFGPRGGPPPVVEVAERYGDPDDPGSCAGELRLLAAG